MQGLLRRGRCGRIMQIAYPGLRGNVPRYLCGRARILYGTEQNCQSIGGHQSAGTRWNRSSWGEVFTILEPAALAATAQALAEAETHHRTWLAAFELAVERARYEAERARRQFDAVEPENRLVARTLERILEDKLAAQRRAENDLATQKARRPAVLTADELGSA